MLQSLADISTMLIYARHSTRYTYTFFSYATCEWPEIFIQNKVLFCSVHHFYEENSYVISCLLPLNSTIAVSELILGCGIAGFTHNLLLWPQISNCLRRKLR